MPEANPAVLERQAGSEEEAILLGRVRRTLAKQPLFTAARAKTLLASSEETTTGVHRLYERVARGRSVPGINVYDCVTKSKFDNLYGCRESPLTDQARDRRHDQRQESRGRRFGDVGKGCARPSPLPGHRLCHGSRSHLRPAGPSWKASRVVTMDEACKFAAISSSPPPATSDGHHRQHMDQMKHNAIVCNIGHFDSEIQIAGLGDLKWKRSSRRSIMGSGPMASG